MSEVNYRSITGFFYNKRNKTYYEFLQNKSSVLMQALRDPNINTIINDSRYPYWILRHSLGEPGGHEDYSDLIKEKNTSYEIERSEEIKHSYVNGKLRDLNFNGISINIPTKGYSHAVGPIHAGVIEPGHFRFSVVGEIIQHLTIRLGFQKRNISNLILQKPATRVIPISETISGDSTIAYATVFSNIYEEACNLTISDEVKLIRMALLEIERIAIHIGDLGAIAGDIGYYPLLGLCSTDRGVPLGAMETLTGSRFGKGAIWPGEIRLNKKLTVEHLKAVAVNLQKAFKRVEREFFRAIKSSTARERLHDCGFISHENVTNNGFVGMAARSAGVQVDLRLGEPLYKLTKTPLQLIESDEHLQGDAFSRFYLRYLEIKNSIEWLTNVLPELDISKSGKGDLLINQNNKFKYGMYYKSVEGWRGSVLVAVDLSERGLIHQAYIRDPSVMNWHALELAVRGELIGDFPLNNKSFNLSYVGFDL